MKSWAFNHAGSVCILCLLYDWLIHVAGLQVYIEHVQICHLRYAVVVCCNTANQLVKGPPRRCARTVCSACKSTAILLDKHMVVMLLDAFKLALASVALDRACRGKCRERWRKVLSCTDEPGRASCTNGPGGISEEATDAFCTGAGPGMHQRALKGGCWCWTAVLHQQARRNFQGNRRCCWQGGTGIGAAGAVPRREARACRVNGHCTVPGQYRGQSIP